MITAHDFDGLVFSWRKTVWRRKRYEKWRQKKQQKFDVNSSRCPVNKRAINQYCSAFLSDIAKWLCPYFSTFLLSTYLSTIIWLCEYPFGGLHLSLEGLPQLLTCPLQPSEWALAHLWALLEQQQLVCLTRSSYCPGPVHRTRAIGFILVTKFIDSLVR